MRFAKLIGMVSLRLAAGFFAVAAVHGAAVDCGENAQMLTLKSVSDSPDPFDPAVQTCRIDAAYEYLSFGRDIQTRLLTVRHVLRDSAEIMSAGGSVVRVLNAEAPASHQSLFQRLALTLSRTWDGRDSGGALVPAGEYSYSVRGELAMIIRIEVPRPGKPPIIVEHAMVIARSGAMGGTISVAFDRTPPVISELMPADKSFVREKLPLISAKLSDPAAPGETSSGVDASTLAVKLDGAAIAPQSAGAGGFSYLPESELSEGRHAVEATVRDVAGNEGRAAWEFTVDTVAPTVFAMKPEEGSVTNLRRPELSASFSDATSGVDVASVSVMLDGAKLALGDGELSADGFRTMPGEPLSEGPHALTVILRDRAGNETVRHSQFRVDASGPAKRRGVC